MPKIVIPVRTSPVELAVMGCKLDPQKEAYVKPSKRDDMTAAYAIISAASLSLGVRCPEIRLFESKVQAELTPRLVWEQGHVLYLPNHCGLDVIWKATELLNDCLRENNTSIRLRDQMAELYQFATWCAAALRIPCPQIIVSNVVKQEFPGVHGVAMSTWDNKATKYILLREDMSLNSSLMALAHEMRHAWQHRKNPKKYFTGYPYGNRCRNLDAYYSQTAELDANAWAMAAMRDYFQIEPYDCTPNELANRIILDKCAKIAIDHDLVSRRISSLTEWNCEINQPKDSTKRA